jgi:hypothetical protein
LGNTVKIYCLRIVYSFLLAIVVLIALLILKHFNVIDVFNSIQRYRGTEHYVGETKTVELMFISTKIIIPIIFLGFMTYFILRLQKRK